MSTDSIRECIECGRRGVREFEPASGIAWRCANRDQCLRRQHNPSPAAPGGPPPAGAAGESRADATAAALAGLAREVEALRGTVTELRGVAGQVDDVARVVGDLAERVADLAARPAPGTAESWLDLPADTAVAAEVVRQLVDWLGEVFLRYTDARQVLPDCWLWHPDVVEELLWLMAMWHTAYHTDEATAAKAGDWHDRYRPGVVRRLKTAVGTCSLDTHVPRGDRAPVGRPVVPLADAMASVTEWWAGHRHDPAPVPTVEQLASTDRVPGGAR